MRPSASRRCARSPTWASSPGRRSRTSGSTRVFIGSCTNRGSRTSGRLPPSLDGRRVRAGVRALVVPGSAQVKVRRKPRGSTDLRSAGAEWRNSGLLDVPRHEPRRAAARRAMRNHEQPELRRAPGARRTHPGQPAMAAAARSPAISSTCATGGPRWPGMKPFRAEERWRAVPLDRADVDTDQIIPKQFLKRIERTGFGEFLFYDWRAKDRGRVPTSSQPPSTRREPAGRGAQLRLRLVARACGLGARGLRHPRRHRRSPSATSSGTNALGSGLVPVPLPEHEVRSLLDLATEQPGITVAVDLETETVTCGDLPFRFISILRATPSARGTRRHLADARARCGDHRFRSAPAGVDAGPSRTAAGLMATSSSCPATASGRR